MSDRTNIAVMKQLKTRYEQIAGFYGYRSFTNYVEHAVMEQLDRDESKYEVHKLEKERIERSQEDLD